jgi:hypothetical protein
LLATRAVRVGQVVQVAAQLQGREIRRELVSDSEFGARLTMRGAPPGIVEIALGFYRAGRAGEFEAVDATLERLMGRPPKTTRDALRLQT